VDNSTMLVFMKALHIVFFSFEQSAPISVSTTQLASLTDNSK